jgi:hypothetical protein
MPLKNIQNRKLVRTFSKKNEVGTEKLSETSRTVRNH